MEARKPQTLLTRSEMADLMREAEQRHTASRHLMSPEHHWLGHPNNPCVSIEPTRGVEPRTRCLRCSCSTN